MLVTPPGLDPIYSIWSGSPSHQRRSWNRTFAHHQATDLGMHVSPVLQDNERLRGDLGQTSSHTSDTSFAYVSVNAGKSCGVLSGILKLIEGAKANGGVTCAYVSEFDAKTRHIQYRTNVRQWTIYRHWPGSGSFAMAFMIPAGLRKFVSAVLWQGRAGAVHLCLPNTELFLVGTHLAHNVVFWDSVADIAHVLLRKPENARTYLAGDFNVDLLTALPDLCFPESASSDAVEKLGALQGLVRPVRLVLNVPRPSITRAGGPFSDMSIGRPVSRIPEGQQCDWQRPSCLDFAFTPKNELAETFLSWHMRPADHAYLHIIIPDAKANIIFAPSTVHLQPPEVCTEWLHANAPLDIATLESFRFFALLFIQENIDKRTRRQRRDQRMPQHVKELFSKSETATSEHARRHYRSQAILFLRRHYQEQCVQQAHCRQPQGRLLQSSSHLHRITEMVLTAEASGVAACGTLSANRADWQREVSNEFGKRWAHNDYHKRSIINDYLARSDGAPLQITYGELWAAVNAIKSSNRLDSDGLTANSIRLLTFACPDMVLQIVKLVLASRQHMNDFIIEGQMRGKTSSSTTKHDVRVILPLPSILCLCDCILAKKIETYLNQLLPNEPLYFAGAQKGTQTSDVVFPIVLAIEKGLDYNDEAAAAVADIKSYYDSLSPLRIVQWLLDRGVPEVICMTFLRIHIVPRIRICFDRETFFLPARACGLLTGTRTANVAARIPVGDVCQKLAPTLRRLGYPTPNGTHAVSSWVDNLTSLARNATDACAILEAVRESLKRDWQLDFKPSSMELLSVAPLEVVCMNGYLVKEDLKLLGHFVSANGSLDYAWKEVRKRVYAALFSKFRSCNVSVLTLEGVAEEIQRHLWPILKYRSNNWPFRKDIAQRMDGLQTQCIAIAAGISPELDEPVEDFHRRRAKTAGVAATLRGRWSSIWAKQVCNWNDHNQRNSSGMLWGFNIMQVRPSSWLNEMRARFVPTVSSAINPFTIEAGRLGTRRRRGGPHRRWEDSVHDARLYVESERLTGLLKFGRERKSAQKYSVKAVATLTGEQLERFDGMKDDEEEQFQN